MFNWLYLFDKIIENTEVIIMNKYDNISWDEYFMGMAVLSSLRSKDPSTKVGAVIVSPENKVISIGYNGMPAKLDEDQLTWNKGEGLDSKYLYVCHAEFNAILNTQVGGTLKNARVYVTLFPCNECTKAIIQTGIKEIIYLDDKYADTIGIQASKKMLDLAGIKYRQFKVDDLEIRKK